MGRVKNALLCRMALCIALMCISSYIAIPLPFTGVLLTAQTLVVNITALLLGPADALICLSVYALIGAVGLPVFSGANAGIGFLLGPNGGYIFGFIAAAFLVSLLKGQKIDFKRYALVTLFVGMPVIYFFATAFMAFFLKKGIAAAVTALVLPFIPLDIAKCIASAYMCVKLEKILKNNNLM